MKYEFFIKQLKDLICGYKEYTNEDKDKPKDMDNWAFSEVVRTTSIERFKYNAKLQRKNFETKDIVIDSVSNEKLNNLITNINYKFNEYENKQIDNLICGCNEDKRDVLYFVLSAIYEKFERDSLQKIINDKSVHGEIMATIDNYKENTKAFGISDSKPTEELIIKLIYSQPSAFTIQDSDGMNIAMHAAKLGFERVTRLGLGNQEVAFQHDKFGKNIISYASEAGMKDVKHIGSIYNHAMSFIKVYENSLNEPFRKETIKNFDNIIYNMCKTYPLVLTIWDKQGKNIRQCLTGLGLEKSIAFANKYAIYEKNNKFQNLNKDNGNDIDRTKM